jgi:hypothetical protein
MMPRIMHCFKPGGCFPVAAKTVFVPCHCCLKCHTHSKRLSQAGVARRKVGAWGGEWGLQRGVSGATAARGQGRDTEQAEGAYCCFTNCKAATASGLLAPSHPSDSFAKHSCVYVATQCVLCESGIQRASMS